MKFENKYSDCLKKQSKSHGITVKNSDEVFNNYDLIKNKNIDIVMANDVLKNELIYDLINFYENLDNVI